MCRLIKSDTSKNTRNSVVDASIFRVAVARERFLDRGLKIVRSCQRLGGEAPQNLLFSNARF